MLAEEFYLLSELTHNYGYNSAWELERQSMANNWSAVENVSYDELLEMINKAKTSNFNIWVGASSIFDKKAKDNDILLTPSHLDNRYESGYGALSYGTNLTGFLLDPARWGAVNSENFSVLFRNFLSVSSRAIKETSQAEIVLDFFEHNPWAVPLAVDLIKNDEHQGRKIYHDLETLKFLLSEDISRIKNGRKSILFLNQSSIQKDISTILQSQPIRWALLSHMWGQHEVIFSKILEAFIHKYGLEALEEFGFAEFILSQTRNDPFSIKNYAYGSENKTTPEMYKVLFDMIYQEEQRKGSSLPLTRASERFWQAGGILGPNEMMTVAQHNYSLEDLTSAIKFLRSQESNLKNRFEAEVEGERTEKLVIQDWIGKIILPLSIKYFVSDTNMSNWMLSNYVHESDKTTIYKTLRLHVSLELDSDTSSESYKINRFDKDSFKEGYLQEMLDYIISSKKSADNLLVEVTNVFPESALRNLLLFAILLKKFDEKGMSIGLSMAYRIAAKGLLMDQRPFLDFDYLNEKIEKLGPNQKGEIRSFIQLIAPYLVYDLKLEATNQLGVTRAYKSAELTWNESRKYESNKDSYSNVTNTEIGGELAQLDIFIPKLNREFLEEQIVGDMPFTGKLKVIQDHFAQPSPTRDYFLGKLLNSHQDLTEDNISLLLPLFNSPVLREQSSLKAMDIEMRKNGSPASAQAEVILIKKYFPNPSYMRDDLLKDAIERWVHRPEDDIMTPLLLSHPLNMLNDFQKKAVGIETVTDFIIREENPVKRAELLVWFFVDRDNKNKPAWLKKFEYRYEVNLDSLKTQSDNLSQFYPNAGAMEKQRLVESLLYGQNGVLENVESKKILLNNVFNVVFPDNKDQFLWDVFDSIFANADIDRQGHILEALLNLLSQYRTTEKSLSNERVIAGFLQSLGLIGVKIGQALNISELQDRADPIPRGLVLDMLVKFYGNFDEFEGVYERLGQASIRNTFRVVLKNGQPVVLKVKRPEIEKVIQEEITLFKAILTDLKQRGHILPQGLVERVEGMIREELDFTIEVKNQQELAANIAKRPSSISQNQKVYEFKVPIAFAEKENVILLEELVGEAIRFNDKQKLIDLGVDPQELSQVVRKELVRQMLEDGVYHFDPNAGNILIQVSGNTITVNFIDVASIRRLSPENRELLKTLGKAIESSDANKIFQVFSSDQKFWSNVSLRLGLTKILSKPDTFPLKFISVLTWLEENKIAVPEQIMEMMRFWGAVIGWWGQDGDMAMLSQNYALNAVLAVALDDAKTIFQTNYQDNRFRIVSILRQLSIADVNGIFRQAGLDITLHSAGEDTLRIEGQDAGFIDTSSDTFGQNTPGAANRINQADMSKPGGIDFNRDKMDLQIQNQGDVIKFNLDPAMLEQLQNAPGFVPVIINIVPMSNLPLFLSGDKSPPTTGQLTLANQ